MESSQFSAGTFCSLCVCCTEAVRSFSHGTESHTNTESARFSWNLHGKHNPDQCERKFVAIFAWNVKDIFSHTDYGSADAQYFPHKIER